MTGFISPFPNVLRLCLMLLAFLNQTIGQIAYQEPFYKGATEAKLREGGYEGVVVAISPQVSEDEQLITRIKEVFSDFSDYLYEVSRQTTYLKEVRILVPYTWSDKSNYESAVSERFEESDIRIDNPPDENLPNRNLPYTNKPTFCGSQGFYIHLTPDYLKNENVATLFGSYKKVLAHEWAHYRWGVFDEYPLPGDAVFYQSSSGSIEGVRCTTAVTGKQFTADGSDCIIPPNGFPGDDCRFFDDRIPTPTTASLMYKQFLEQVTEYCDDGDNVNNRVRHNAEAPNLHNTQCFSRSVWQVMRDHPDFLNSDTPVTKRSTNFVEVRERPSRYVLVIDTSASMTFRLRVLRQACYIFIHQVLLDGESLAIVEFNDEAATLKELTEVQDNNRQSFVQELPALAKGSTAIGGGVLEALNALNRSGELTTLGGRLIVLTDGQQTQPPFIDDIIKQTDSVLIHTIAIGKYVDERLETLANRTGGRQFFHQDASTALFDIFSQFGVESRGANSEELVSRYIPLLQPNRNENIEFVRDITLRGGIVVYVAVLASSPAVVFGGESSFSVRLQSPTGTTTTSSYDPLVAVYTLKTDSTQNGTWTLSISSMDTKPLNVSILVLAKTEEGPMSLPITANGLWAAADLNPPNVQTAYFTLARGYNPVIDPEVNAVIETPRGVRQMKLFDDGVGEDIIKGDGVYSGFFTHFAGTGRYSIRFSVRGTGRIVKGARVGIGAAVDPALGDAEWDLTYEPVGDVQRTITGGSFTCNNNRTCSAVSNYGPYRVTTLVVKNVDRDNRTFDLVFTSPGADLMDGTASRYDIRFSTNFGEFMKSFISGESIGMAENDLRPYILTGNLNQPLVARSTEIFTIVLPPTTEQVVYFFALTAEDEQSLESPASNIVSVSPKSGTFATLQPPNPSATQITRMTSTADPGDGTLLLVFIVGAALIFLLLIVIFILSFLLLRRKKKEEEHRSEGPALKKNENITESVKYETVRENVDITEIHGESNKGFNTEQGDNVNRGIAEVPERGPYYAHRINQGQYYAHRIYQGNFDDTPYLEANNTALSGKDGDQFVKVGSDTKQESVTVQDREQTREYSQ